YTRPVPEMLRPRNILLFILLMLFSVFSIRQVIPQSVPCLVYPPGHACATLPTIVSLQPTSITWVAHLYVKNSSKIFTCLRLEPQQGQIDVKLYRGQCGTDVFNRTTWPKNFFTAGSWTNLHVRIVKDEAAFSISGHYSASISLTIDTTSADFFTCLDHQEAVLAAYDCYSGCYFYSTPKSLNKTKLMSLVITSTFFLYALPEFKSLHFSARFSNYIGGYPHPVRKTLNRIPDTFTWNKVQVVIQKDKYLVYVNDQLVLESEPYPINPLADISVVTEGPVFYSIECKPQ
ncbi:hypothetical protein OTU49_015323, partial [Cherax quadricarinatus]